MRPSLAALLAGGVGVAAVGVIVGSAGFDPSRARPERAGEPAGGFAMPVAAGGGPSAAAGGPLGMSTVPAAPVPILDLGSVPVVAPSPGSRNEVQQQTGRRAVVTVESSTGGPRHAVPTTAAAAVAELPAIEAPPVTEEPTEEPVEAPTQPTGRHRRDQVQDQSDRDRSDQARDDQARGDQDQIDQDQGRNWQRDARSDWWGDGHQWRPWWERQE
ncbi:hypothetical protein GCM10018962_13910 [Dactylosporangium matsuzakiense]|uniref:Uncharacterized protein n=1 Tax=Dactylosporangium matsuzakiense TaxID=53360 RepID=A0A9W6NRA4_9ACTN|nr:hypothetical protein GCM10017581_077300 [Dactylosporangium matsuzakiense]